MLSQKILFEAYLLADKAFTVPQMEKIEYKVSILVLSRMVDDSSFLGLLGHYRLCDMEHR